MVTMADQRRIMLGKISILQSVPISDRIILTKAWDVETHNLYNQTIREILPTLIEALEKAGKENYAEVKLKSLRSVIKKLWVDAQKEETFTILLDFEAFEKMLFQSNSDYRGHYVHQFDVFLLGYYILNTILESRKPAASIFNGNSNLTWMLASTFHDMGYPIQQIDQWFSSFLGTFLKIDTVYQIEIEKIVTPVFYDYLKFISEEHYNLTTEPIAISGQSPTKDWVFHSILQTNLRKKNHGVISSLLLIHSLFTKEKTVRSNNWFLNAFPRDVLPACHAIALHALPQPDLDAIGGISLSKCPYAFLLALCDAIQDWQRSLGKTDYSELEGIDFDMSGIVPVLTFNINIDTVAFADKARELTALEKNLKTDGLLNVVIKQSNGNGEWKL